MAMIVAGRFTTFDQANLVASRLYDRSFRPSDVSVFFLNPTGQHARFPMGGDVDADAAARPASRGAAQGVVAGGAFGLAMGALLYVAIWRFWLVPVVGMMAGAYLGAFLGALRRMQSRERVSARQAGMRDAGVMLATHVSESTADTAIAVLRDAGAAEIEQANGVWEGGEWRDFDPVQHAHHAQDVPSAREVEPRAEPTIGVAANERSTRDGQEGKEGRERRDETRVRPRRTDWL
ncbi:hypothetical protein [Pandoraea sputorum]|uniref:Glycine zipper domain-containing protein n=1 Tax=Pandoraea sputorum TaxID=93222 RepID=A0A239S8R6_9BURK|nr:hypothetical protein [Pandoraea sputorum]APD12271.1 hypothetical protein NA29_07555 [Pandoraea sputorum]SNU81826.1 Uncharacterised protein [Pandoraea sputorum]VVD62838.1 hypothetical protein PSP20601_00188 [Pandoraea sputorum]